MPIQERTIVDLREEMVLLWLSERYTAEEVVSRFDSTRPTLYKWTERYRAQGRAGLEDRSRAPKSCPHKTPVEMERMILAAKKKLGWGPKKLIEVLRTRSPQLAW